MLLRSAYSWLHLIIPRVCAAQARARGVLAAIKVRILALEEYKLCGCHCPPLGTAAQIVTNQIRTSV